VNPLYASEDWRSIDPFLRAELLLVIEDVKPGAFIAGDWGPFQRIIRESDLECTSRSSQYDIHLHACVAAPERLREFFRDKLQPLTNKTVADIHRIDGKFLGYPQCCVKEYSHQSMIRPFGAKKSDTKHPFRRELGAMIAEHGSYPAVFDYRPPAFTPCSAHCDDAIATLNTWKDALERNDPDAARALVEFNWEGEPEREAHKEYWDALTKERELQSTRQWFLGTYNAQFEAQLRKHKKLRAIS